MRKLSSKRIFPKCPKCGAPGRCYWHQEKIYDVVNDVWSFGCQCGYYNVIRIQVYPLVDVTESEKLHRSCPFCHKPLNLKKPHPFTNRDMSCPRCGRINYYECTKGEDGLYVHKCKRCKLNFSTPDSKLTPRDKNGKQKKGCPACKDDLLAYADVPPR